MKSADGKHVIVFNGEIYNFRELQEKYLSGVALHSHSDTEVLLHLLLRKGKAILPELRGMFAFAWWNPTAEELFLARDPFGKKPLSYLATPELFAFASEPKALLPLLPAATLDQEAVASYAVHEYVPVPRTGFADVMQLPMGHALHVSAEKMNLQSWHSLTFTPKMQLTEKQAASKFDELLGQAVERRLIADVPVGVFLSGGLDSSTILWYVRQATKAPLHSFSVSFAEASFNEGHFAKQAADALDTIHHDQLFDLAAFHQVVGQLQDIMDVPFGDASLLPTYLISKAARQHITVALDGDGSDELLGGYGTFAAAEAASRLPPLPQALWRAVAAASGSLPTSYDYFSLDFKIKSFIKGLPYPPGVRNQIWLGSFSDNELAALLKPKYQDAIPHVFSDITGAAEEIAPLELFDQVSALTIRNYLQNDILTKLDRATMAVGLEGRTPFLDIDLAEFIMKLPVKYKRNKYILKQLMRGRIADAIIDRPKKGFGIPLGHWLRGPLKQWAQEVLSSDKIDSDGIFNSETIGQLFREHISGKVDHRKKLWTLLAWQLWYDRWIRP
jgi:asparagine synthase (glutamine-hydrolysing)